MQTRNDTQKLSLINGIIHTPTSTASCITFEHGRIVSIDDEAAALNGKVIDLQGKTVLPAFCDTSLDFFGWAEDQERLSLSTVRSLQEFTGALTAYQQSNPEPLRGWYIAQGLPESVNISRDDIDAVIPSRPCAVIGAKRTHAVLNTPAMSEFNMPQDNIELDGLAQHLPPLSTNDILYLIRTYSPKVNALGISEVWIDAYTDAGKIWDIFSSEAYGELSFRVRLNFGFDEVISMNEFLASGLRTGDGLPMCRLGGILVRDDLKRSRAHHQEVPQESQTPREEQQLQQQAHRPHEDTRSRRNLHLKQRGQRASFCVHERHSDFCGLRAGAGFTDEEDRPHGFRRAERC